MCGRAGACLPYGLHRRGVVYVSESTSPRPGHPTSPGRDCGSRRRVQIYVAVTRRGPRSTSPGRAPPYVAMAWPRPTWPASLCRRGVAVAHDAGAWPWPTWPASLHRLGVAEAYVAVAWFVCVCGCVCCIFPSGSFRMCANSGGCNTHNHTHTHPHQAKAT